MTIQVPVHLDYMAFIIYTDALYTCLKQCCQPEVVKNSSGEE